MIAALLFSVYLGINLGALLLASQSQRQPRKYLNSTAVTLSELIKFALSLIAVCGSAPSLSAAVRIVMRTLLGMPDQMLRVALPALLYTIQNNIIYVALSHLDAVTFQITYQLKIVAALLSSRLLLKKKVSKLRWLSVVILTIGVILVQLGQAQAAVQPPMPEAADNTAVGETADGSAAADAGGSRGANGGGGGGGGGGSSSNGGAGGSSSSGDADGDEPKPNRTLGLIGVLVRPCV